MVKLKKIIKDEIKKGYSIRDILKNNSYNYEYARLENIKVYNIMNVGIILYNLENEKIKYIVIK